LRESAAAPGCVYSSSKSIVRRQPYRCGDFSSFRHFEHPPFVGYFMVFLMWTPKRSYPSANSKLKLRRCVERDPVKVNRSGYVGRLPSYRDADPALLVFESLLERDLLVLLESDTNTTQIWPQPLTLTVHFLGHVYRPIPDFFSSHKSGERRLWEVRPAVVVLADDTIVQAEIDAWYDAVADEACRRGFEFHLITERDIRIEPRLSNSRHILRGAGDLVDRRAISAVRAVLAHLPDPVTLGAVRDAAGREVNAFWAIMRMIYRGEIKADMSQPFGDQTYLTRPPS
jgi:hypothetical protein